MNMTTLAPLTTPLQKNTQQAFLFLNVITGACHAVVNQNLQTPDPKPEWFDDLKAKLDTAKSVCNEWIYDLAEDVTKQVPLSIINYDATYQAFTQRINDIANAHPDAAGKDNQYVKEVSELVDQMLTAPGAVNEIIATMDDVDSKLKTWGNKIQTAHNDMQTGTVNIQKAEVDLQTDIDKMNNAIADLHAQIDQENKVVAYSAIGVVVGIFVMVVGIALIPETGGAGVAVAISGGALLVGGAVTWGVMQNKINKQFDEINEDTKELDDDKRQLLCLQGLAAGTNAVVNNLATVSQALSELRTFWGTFKGELEGVQTKLQNAEAGLSIIVQDTFTQAAADEWSMAMETATQLSELHIDFDAKTLSGYNT